MAMLKERVGLYQKDAGFSFYPIQGVKPRISYEIIKVLIINQVEEKEVRALVNFYLLKHGWRKLK